MRRIVRFLASPRLAAALLLFIGAWVTIATFVPQRTTSPGEIAAWDAANPALATVVNAVGLHDAFTAPAFIVPSLLLALCTAVCAWQRTGVARRRARVLREVSAAGVANDFALAELSIPVAPDVENDEAYRRVVATLRELGIPGSRVGDRVVSVSPWWTVWGTAIFHWALVTLIVLMALGSLARASGQMGVAVGQTRPDQPESYGELTAGPLYRWASNDRSIRVDDFHLDYMAGGISRGPTPTVAVLDGDGEVLESRIVYPNHILRHGSLSIYPVDYGLSAEIAMLDDQGAEIQRTVQLLDFDGTSPDGTAPVSEIGLYGSNGQVLNRLIVSVPLDSVPEGFLGRIPKDPSAHVVVADLTGAVLLDEVLRPGEEAALPLGGSLRLLGVDYYARLQIVDDPTITLLYIAGAIALVGLGIATLARQMIFTAGIRIEGEARIMAVRMRLWRIHTTSKTEIESELRRALGATEGSA
jgi:hypothetical protein